MIWLVRHGEAAASWGAHPDPGLSPTGSQQALDVSRRLPEGVSTVISSPMQRCRETAAPFAARLDLPVRSEPRVSEIPTPNSVTDRVAWLRGLMAGTWRDAPSMIQEWRADLIDAVSALPQGSVVFSHFVAINALVGATEGRDDVTVFHPGHCAVTQFTRRDGRLVTVTRGGEADTKVL